MFIPRNKAGTLQKLDFGLWTLIFLNIEVGIQVKAFLKTYISFTFHGLDVLKLLRTRWS